MVENLASPYIYPHIENQIHKDWARTLTKKQLKLLNSGKKIRRHVYGNNYDERVVTDNVYDHVIRSMLIVDLLPVNEEFATGVKKTLLIHDLPEIAVLIETGRDCDITAPEKKGNPGLAEQIQVNEINKAREILSGDDLMLYSDFENVSKFMKGELDYKSLNKIALVAYLIDKIEANLVAHYSLTNWVKSDAYDPRNLPSVTYLTYTFDFGKAFQDKIGKNIDDDIAGLCMNISQNIIQQVKDFWEDVPTELIPNKIADFLD